VMSVGSLSLSHHLLREVVELAKQPEWLDALWEEQQRLMVEYGPELSRQVRTFCPKINACSSCIIVALCAAYAPSATIPKLVGFISVGRHMTLSTFHTKRILQTA
jgi:hypothetical protein